MNITKLTLDPTGWLEINYIQAGGLTLQSTGYHPSQLDLIQADCEKHSVPVPLDEVIGVDYDGQPITVASWLADYSPAPQPLVVPEEVSAAQAQLALLSAGLLDEVEAMMAHPDTPREHRIAWNKAQVFRRDSPTIAAVALVLGLTDEQIDSLFVNASQIQL